MTKYTVKTVLDSVIQDKDGQFTYDQKLVSMKWTEAKGREKYTQSGTGPGEFGPDYSDRKQYHLTGKRSPYPTHVIESYQEEKKMACDNIECNCEGCTCDPCTCTPANLCGCADDHSNDWKGVV